MFKTRTWIVLIASVALLLIALSVFLLTSRSEGSDGGVNRIEVEPGRLRVAAADCPDRICVSQGWLSDQSVPIVCLPHRLIIKLRS